MSSVEELEESLKIANSMVTRGERRLERVIEYTKSRSGTAIAHVSADVIVGICEGRYGDGFEAEEGYEK